MKYLWAVLGMLCIALAAVGIVLPLLPTVPFLLLAAFFFARSSDRMHYWLLSHPTLGPPIEDWQNSGAINGKAKRLATISIAAVFLFSVLIGLSVKLLLIQGLVLSCVLIFLWTRPNA